MKTIPTGELSQRRELMAFSGVKIIGKGMVKEKDAVDRQGSIIYVKGLGLIVGTVEGH